MKMSRKCSFCTHIHLDNTEDSLFFLNLLKISWLWYQVLLKCGCLWRQSVNNLLWISLFEGHTRTHKKDQGFYSRTLIPHSSKWKKTNSTKQPQTHRSQSVFGNQKCAWAFQSAWTCGVKNTQPGSSQEVRSDMAMSTCKNTGKFTLELKKMEKKNPSLNKKEIFFKIFLLWGWQLIEGVALLGSLGVTHSPTGPYMAQPVLGIPALGRGWAGDLQWCLPTSASVSSVQLMIKH